MQFNWSSLCQCQVCMWVAQPKQCTDSQARAHVPCFSIYKAVKKHECKSVKLRRQWYRRLHQLCSRGERILRGRRWGKVFTHLFPISIRVLWQIALLIGHKVATLVESQRVQVNCYSSSHSIHAPFCCCSACACRGLSVTEWQSYMQRGQAA